MDKPKSPAPMVDGRPMAMSEIRDLLGLSTVQEAQRQYRRCREIYGSVQLQRLRHTKPPLDIPSITGRNGRLAPHFQDIAKKGMTRGVINTAMEFGYTPAEIEVLGQIWTGTVKQ